MSDASHPIVLITGSSGFLGQAIARGLMKRYRVIGLDARQPRQTIEGMVTVENDLTSDQNVDASMIQIRESAGTRIASVIHLAAYYDTTGEENPKYDAVTVQGTRRLLGALREFETEQFVFSSTLLVHAPSPEKGVRINEVFPSGHCPSKTKLDRCTACSSQRRQKIRKSKNSLLKRENSGRQGCRLGQALFSAPSGNARRRAWRCHSAPRPRQLFHRLWQDRPAR